MNGLRMLVVGMILVLADLRIQGLDLVPDPVGWLLVLVALRSLVRLDRWFLLAVVGAGLGFLLSLPDMVSVAEGAPRVVAGVLHTLVVFGCCSAVRRQVEQVDPRLAAQAGVVRWIDLALTVVMLALPSGLGAQESVVLVPIVVGYVAVALATIIWFLVLMWRAGSRPEGPASPTAPVPAGA